MFFFFNEDFDGELKNFIVDPRLEEEQHKSARQLDEFRGRFPLERIFNMSSEEYLDPRGGKDDFCHWITDGTSFVTNRLPWAKHKLGVPPNRVFGSFGFERQGWVNLRATNAWRKEFEKRTLDPLRRFLDSHGMKYVEDAERAFGQPLLLKLLYLCYPRDFSNFAKVGWVDRTANAFALNYGHSVYERSHEISRFYRMTTQRKRNLTPTYFACFLAEYLGLSNENRPYLNFLTKHDGISEHTAERFSRSLRQLSRLLVGYRICRYPLFSPLSDAIKISVADLLGNLEKCVGVSPEKMNDYSRAFESYVAYLQDKNEPVQRYAFSVVDTPQIVREEKGDRNKNDDKKSSKDWMTEFGNAKNAEEVACILQRSGSVRPYYRHYTTLSAFLYVADDWMFRLTRGDDRAMNDQLEWKRLGDAELWKRTFISSFSCVEGESAAMWGLYGKPSNEALRLSFEHATMAEWIEALKAGQGCPKAQFFKVGDLDAGKVDLRWEDVQIQFGDVLYGGNVDGSSDSSDGYVFRGRRLKKSLFSEFDPKLDKSSAMTGFVKSADWAYEEEARLIVRVKEDAHLPKGKSLLDVQYVYVPIPKDMLLRVEFMRGPCVPEKLRPIVEEKIKGVLSRHALVGKSKYTDNLKFK